jgi:hypothetical protein
MNRQVRRAFASFLRRFYRAVWLIDFEFGQPDGERPTVRCMVAKDLLSGRRICLWLDGVSAPSCPFSCDDQELFVAYYASAEASCFRALGWPAPRRMLDLFTEFRNTFNGTPLQFGSSLVGALTTFNLPALEAEEKSGMRELAQRGGPYAADEIEALLGYCESDVDALAKLIEPVADAARLMDQRESNEQPWLRLGQALLRGRYMIAAGYHLEWNGVPIDAELFRQIRDAMPDIQRGLIEAIDEDFGVYVGGHFSAERFAYYLVSRGIVWAHTGAGRLRLDADFFKTKTKQGPELRPLHELRTTLSETRLHALAVGPDDRNRTLLSGFRALTGRSAPSNVKSVFGPATWIRSLIKSAEGRAVAYCDYSTQEIAIAAVLSGDVTLWADYQTGDVYLAFAKQIGLVPADAIKATHSDQREACKQLFLGINYGMSVRGFADRTGFHIEQARAILQQHKARYPTFHRWVEGIVNRALLGLPVETVFGWRLWWRPGVEALREDHMAHSRHGEPEEKEYVMRPRTAQNFLMQATGAEMTRLAVCMACDAGLMVDAPIHDALLLEGSLEEIGTQEAPGPHVERLKTLMGDASEVILGDGKRIRVGHEIVRWPDRCSDPRGAQMFETIKREVDRWKMAAE